MAIHKQDDNEPHLTGKTEETPQMREIRLKQEEMRQKALAFEQMEIAKKQREQQRKEEEEIKRNPALAAERERRLAEIKAEEEKMARLREEEMEKIEAERRVQEKKMDQTEALIASIRAQVEKEKAAKAAELEKQSAAAAASANKNTSAGSSKPQFRTISPEEMAKLEEKKRMKAAGIQPGSEGVSGGLEGLGNGPTLSNPLGDGPTLSNPNAGQESLNGPMQGGGLGIDITASLDKGMNDSKADESTIKLSVDEINAAVEKTNQQTNDDSIKLSVESGTIVVDAGNSWDKSDESVSSDNAGWTNAGKESTDASIGGKSTKDSLLDDNGDIISVVPVRRRPVDANDVQSAYNIDFDDDDDDIISFGSSSEEVSRQAEEEARRQAEEEARRKAEEEAKRQAEEEARRQAEEEARRQAEEEARRQAEEEARRQAEEEARRQAEEEARRQAEEEARRQAEEEARRQAEEEAKRKAEEEAKRQAEQTARMSGDEFALPVGAEQFLGKYLSVNTISDQITRTMRYISENPNEPRNMVVLGQYGFGTTTIAEDFARSFYAMGICKTKTIAKIKAGALNRANISDAISKLQGGCLVIENAGVISTEKLGEIYQIVSRAENDVVVIMTGQIENLSKIFKDNVVISTQFKHLIQVHRITDMDVFTIAKNHATQLGYPCEESAENNLRKRMQEVESGNLDRVLKIVDNAVSKAHNREMTTGDQEHRLVPSDFE